MKSKTLWHKKTLSASKDRNFFPTEPEITSSFMMAEAPILRQMGITRISEPFCGAGAMARVIKDHGFRVISSDLADRGYGTTGKDFFQTTRAEAPAIITNPPYEKRQPQRVITQARAMGVRYLAMLLKVQFWNPQCNSDLWATHRPAREYKIGWRPDFLDLGGGQLDVCFWVWDFTQPVKRTDVFILTKDGRCL